MNAERTSSPRPIVSIEERNGTRYLTVPGFVSAHSHAFQRGLRGKAQRTARSEGTFWSWRDAMYSLAESLTPESIYAHSFRAFRELASVGVVAVGEFHYVHHNSDGTPYTQRTLLADTVIEAALAAGLRISLLRVAYARAGQHRGPEGVQRRFCDPSPEEVLRDVEALRTRWSSNERVRVGIAPHSVRAVPRSWLAPLASYAQQHKLPLHMHVAEQPAEIEACKAEHGVRPVELLARSNVLSPQFTVVHGTHLTPHEVRLLSEHNANVCICPTTERDLGDGLPDIELLRASNIALSVGVDSHVLTDHIEEMRALETNERLRLQRRVTVRCAPERTPAEQLLVEGSIHGAKSLGFSAQSEGNTVLWEARTAISLRDAICFEGVCEEELADALLFSGTRLSFERWE